MPLPRPTPRIFPTPRRRAFATFTAVAAIGTLGIVLATLAVLVRDQVQRTQSVRRQAQARQLLIAAMAADGDAPALPPSLTDVGDKLTAQPLGPHRVRLTAQVQGLTLTNAVRLDPHARPHPGPLTLTQKR